MMNGEVVTIAFYIRKKKIKRYHRSSELLSESVMPFPF